MQKVRDYSKLIASSKVLLSVLFSSILISLFIIIPMLPYAVGQNLLDLKFGFQRDDVGFAFSILGDQDTINVECVELLLMGIENLYDNKAYHF